MPEALVRQDLDHMECARPDCPGGHPLFFSSRCHPGTGVDCGYERESGTLLIKCHACKATMLRLRVAEATLQ